MYRYFFQPAPLGPLLAAELAVRAEPTLGFAHYLRGLQQAGRGLDAAAARSLEHALALGLPGDSFVRNAARRLAIVGYRAGEPARVRAAIAVLDRPTQPAIDRLVAQDWQERLAFDAAH